MNIAQKVYNFIPKKVLHGSAVVFIMSLFSALLGYGIRIALAKSVSPTEVGLFYSVLTVVIFWFFLRELGFSSAVPKYIAEYKALNKYDEIKTVTRLMMIVCFVGATIIALFIYLSSDWLSINYFHHSAASWMLKAMCIYVYLSIIFVFYKSILQGFQQIYKMAWIEPLKNLFLLLAILFFAKEYGLKSVVIGLLISGPLIGLIFLKTIWRLIRLKDNHIVAPWATFKTLFWFGLPIMFTELGGEFISFFDTLVLTYFNPLSDVGVYNIILPTATAVLMLGRAIGTTIYPMVSEYKALGKTNQIKEAIKKMYKWSWLLVFPWILSMVLAKPFISLLFGNEYLIGILPLRILFTGSFLYIVGSINIFILSASGWPVDNAKVILSAALLNVVANIIMIPIWGMTAAAITTSASYLWALIYSTILIKKRILNAI